MPEDLPTPKKSLKQLEKENKKQLKLNNIQKDCESKNIEKTLNRCFSIYYIL